MYDCISSNDDIYNVADGVFHTFLSSSFTTSSSDKILFNLSKFSDEKILKLSGIIDNSAGKIVPTLAGMFVFGEFPQGFFPQLFIAAVVVPGRKLGDVGEMGQRFDDNKRIEGNIFVTSKIVKG